MPLKGFHPGTTWRKADLQCHTARDYSWNGTTELPGSTASEIAARDAWADRFIAACVTKGVQVAAVTDHHDLCMAEYIERAANRDGNRVLVFPGIEVTCSDNAQCLVIIDPSASRELRAKFLSFRGFTAHAPELGRAPQSAPVGLTVAELFQMINGDPDMRNNAVVLPHFSDGNAHKHINQPSTQLRFIDIDCDGVYVEKGFAELDDETKRKAYGKIPEWGDKRHAIIPTGDNRHEDWRRLGHHDCWIKLGENSVEALRQAMLADEARISMSTPAHPADRVISLQVKSTLTGDQPLSVSFNDGFTAIIGGRGSGKSSVLEYLRFALARTVTDFPTGEVVSSGGKEQTLIQETLEAGFVEVVLDRSGIRETWRRELHSKDHITVTDDQGVETKINIGDAQRKFRARAFYQKGLSSTVNDPATAADQITGIAAAEVLERRRVIEQDIEKARLGVRNWLGQVAAHWLDKLEHRRSQSQSDDLKQRLEAVSSRLDREGISPETKAVLARAPLYTRSSSWIDELDRETTAVETLVLALKEQSLVPQTDIEAARTEFPEIASLSEAAVSAQASIVTHLEAALANIASLNAARETVMAQFAVRTSAFASEHQNATAAQSAHAALIEESTQLTKQHEAAITQVASSAATEARSNSAVAGLRAARGDLQQLLNDRHELLKEAASHVAGRSSQRLEAIVKSDPCPSEYIASLCRLLQSSYVSDPETKCIEWVRGALKAEPDKAWHAIVKSILEVYEAKVLAGSPADPSADMAAGLKSLFFGGQTLSAAQTKRIFGNLNDGTVGELLAAVPRDYIGLRYIDDHGRKKPFPKASPGQQASALLELLLQQTAGTLIVDQPEDDLDNRVVMNIVELIKTSKCRRQLIFTTHNPNFVVNGDADKVVALATIDNAPGPTAAIPEINIDVDGAIETPEIRGTITRIMEGGRSAFELRRRKYRFDKTD